MTGRSKIAVHFYIEDGFLVRGTLDPCTALGWAVAEDDHFESRYHYAGMAIRPPVPTVPFAPDPEPGPKDIAVLANLCHDLILTARPGLYRMNVVGPGHYDDYSWITGHPKERGRGVFEGVEFDV